MMDKRTLLALALSFAVIAGYPLLLQKLYPEKYAEPATQSSERTDPAATAARPASGKPAASAAMPRFFGDKELSFSEADDLPVETRNLRLVFNRANGALREAEFRRYRDAEKGGNLKLFSLDDAEGAPFSVVVDATGAMPSAPARYSLETPSGVLVMRGELVGGTLGVTKEFSISEDAYHGTMKVRFENRSQEPLDLEYRLSAGPSFPPRNSIDGQYSEANFYSVDGGDKASLRHITEKSKGKTVASDGPLAWLAVKDRQFALILQPKSGVPFTGLVAGLGDHRFRASLGSPRFRLGPGESLEHDFLFYLGPVEVRQLMPLGLEPIVHFGKLDWIARLLVGALEMLHRVSGNYGVAIILLTVLINVLLFPLTRASYMSMKRMQLIQPQMNKLKEQHKKNPEKMNREMMELYKKHKVNPFGGCLPMLLQMPVFMALYVALSKQASLMNSKFLWIRDLSSPDRVQLPFSLPFLGDQVHALPLVMVAAMTLQQRFTQVKMEGQDPAMEAQQKMMAWMMPLLFGFIFYTMPSGLVLYWLTNTLLMTSYQLHLKKMKLDAP